MHDIETTETKYEKRDANIQTILLFGGGLVILMVVALVFMWIMFNAFATREARQDIEPSPLATARQPSTEPKLQVDPPSEIAKLRLLEENLLNSYAWVNEEAGVARIPISQAMAMLVNKGLPTRSEVKDNESHEQ